MLASLFYPSIDAFLWSSLLYLHVADYRCCRCCSNSECYSCCSKAGPKIVLEGCQVCNGVKDILPFEFVISFNLPYIEKILHEVVCDIFYIFMSSNFSEIFDIDWFITFLSKDVKIIKQLPKRGGRAWTPYNMRVPRKCSERCYQNRVLPVLLKRHVSPYFSNFQFKTIKICQYHLVQY